MLHASRKTWTFRVWALIAVSVMLLPGPTFAEIKKLPEISEARMFFVVGNLNGTGTTEIEMGFYPDVAPITVDHILTLGYYNAFETAEFFRIEPGFVAQVSDVYLERRVPIPWGEGRQESCVFVPLEPAKGRLRHRHGILSMARSDDPDSNTSGFSIIYGEAEHLDEQYTIFGKVLRGLSTVDSWQTLEIRQDPSSGMMQPVNGGIEILKSYTTGFEPKKNRPRGNCLYYVYYNSDLDEYLPVIAGVLLMATFVGSMVLRKWLRKKSRRTIRHTMY